MPPARRSRAPTWQLVSRIAGLFIIFSLLVAYLFSEVTGHQLDSALALAFLGIGSGLIGAPDGFTLTRRGGDIHIGPAEKKRQDAA